MKFSILIAHYNNWEYFQECYKSIISQTYQNFEIVIVDDFSNDDSFEKLSDLAQKDSKIKLFRNTENKKVGFTKSRCVNEANGEICLFVDPDDKIAFKALETINETYINNPSIIATYSKIKLIDENSNFKGIFKQSQKIKNNQLNFFNINFEVAHLFSFKREAYNKTIGINEKLTSAVDQDLYMKLYEIGEFYFINSYQYLYRIHDKGVSQDKTKKDKLGINWHQVLFDTCKRRGITKLFDKSVDSIDSLPKFIFQKENTLFRKLKRKLGW